MRVLSKNYGPLLEKGHIVYSKEEAENLFPKELAEHTQVFLERIENFPKIFKETLLEGLKNKNPHYAYYKKMGCLFIIPYDLTEEISS